MSYVYLKIFRETKRTLVAACDKELLGETFREGKLKLEVKAEFYGGSLSPIEKAIEALAGADIANLVGRRVVDAAINRGLVDRQAVIWIGGVPHVQVVRV